MRYGVMQRKCTFAVSFGSENMRVSAFIASSASSSSEELIPVVQLGAPSHCAIQNDKRSTLGHRVQHGARAHQGRARSVGRDFQRGRLHLRRWRQGVVLRLRRGLSGHRKASEADRRSRPRCKAQPERKPQFGARVLPGRDHVREGEARRLATVRAIFRVTTPRPRERLRIRPLWPGTTVRTDCAASSPSVFVVADPEAEETLQRVQ